MDAPSIKPKWGIYRPEKAWNIESKILNPQNFRVRAIFPLTLGSTTIATFDFVILDSCGTTITIEFWAILSSEGQASTK